MLLSVFAQELVKLAADGRELMRRESESRLRARVASNASESTVPGLPAMDRVAGSSLLCIPWNTRSSNGSHRIASHRIAAPFVRCQRRNFKR